MERLGLLGGTFDPPHNGHRTLAAESLHQLRLDGVLWVLTPDPPHKDLPDITPYAVRRAMLLAAIADNPAFFLCEVESERPGPHYMADTISILKKRNPGAEYTLLLGEDSLRDLPLWHHPRDVITLCQLAILRRPDQPADMAALEKLLPGISMRTVFLDTPPVDISSTEIRERVARGESIRGFLPAAVEKIIRREFLYQLG